MVSSDVEKLVSDVKLSSVVPARMTGEDKIHELSNMELVTKLHYLKGLYFFSSEAAEGLDIYDLKMPMFGFLELYYRASGRIRRPEDDGGGRPLIKCNDSGVRIVEAKCSRTVDEWLAMDDCSLNDQLVYHRALGPDLGFAPLVFIQFTWFKCGGMSIGLSWAHVLGDAFTASNFLNMWGQSMAGKTPSQFIDDKPKINKFQQLSSIGKLPFSIKKVDPVGDHWLITNTYKMQSHSFHIPQKQLNQHISKIFGPIMSPNVSPFDVICATIWKILAKVRGESSEPKIVTICRDNGHCRDRETEISSNGQLISIVVSDVKVSEAETAQLAKLIGEGAVDVTSAIDEVIDDKEIDHKSDYVLYGANLTFVNLEEANVYGLEIKGHKPVFASYDIGGVGDEGVVIVLPGPENLNGKEGGRIVNMILPEYELEELKNEVREEFNIF